MPTFSYIKYDRIGLKISNHAFISIFKRNFGRLKIQKGTYGLGFDSRTIEVSLIDRTTYLVNRYVRLNFLLNRNYSVVSISPKEYF